VVQLRLIIVTGENFSHVFFPIDFLCLEQGRINPCPFVAFEEQRKVHYDEYHKMKELLQKGTMNDDADEDESVPDKRKE